MRIGLICVLVGIVRHVCALAQPRCERIAATMCQGLGYNTTHMPNFLGHASQEEAILELRKLDDLLSSKCSPFLRLFVCSLYIPLCSEHVPGAVPACKGLCEEVSFDCSHALRQGGFHINLNCSSFPEPPDLCMQQPPEDDDFTGNADITSSYVFNRHQRKCPPNLLRVGGNCIRVPLKYPAANDDKLVVKVWILTWSILAIVVVVFTLLTFIMQPMRFRWPARPILFLTICGLTSSLLYFAQWTLARLSCTEEGVARQLDSRIYLVFVLLHTYFDFAYSLWWCTFSYVWYLSASKEWSTEAIEKVAARVHSIVWSLSGVPIVHVLVFSSFKSNSFTGFCEMSSLVLTMVQVFVVVLGMMLAVLTSQGLRRVRAALVYAGRSPHKLERLIYRLGFISLGISVPLLISVLCYFSDSLYVELLKVCMRYLSIIFSTLWVVSYKTFRRWNKILRPHFTNKGMIRNAPVTKV